tara:strand:+ start:132 stop:1010 length:879 start_codon:yes stop_codon:yes gene_type:complete
MTQILDALFSVYANRVPDVRKITKAMIDQGIVANQSDIINDHVAFRTLGVPYLGIASFEKIFLAHGYQKKEFYHFNTKKLDAFWYAPPTSDLPRIFISELKVDELSASVQKVIKKYTDTITSDPVNSLDLNNHQEVAAYFQTPLWQLPSLEDYETLLAENEYAAWVIYNRYYLNHYTISVHDLPDNFCALEPFNVFLKSIGIQLNTAGGEIKTSKDKLLRQTSSVANKVLATFSGNKTKEIAGSYVEFAERSPLPEFSKLPKNELKRIHRREGFETGNADRIFESTFTSQLK